MTVLLADDHRIMRQGLHGLLKTQPSVRVVAEAADGNEAVRLAAELAPDLVVMDLRMPGLDGVEATRQIVGRRPSTKVIGLSGDRHVEAGRQMLRAGAAGYVFKEDAVEELLTAIDVISRGGTYVSASMNGEADAAGNGVRSTTGLSPREREVLILVANGRSTKQAARDLSVSVKTIETHRRNLMEKLQIDNVAGLTKYAIRAGMCGL